MRKLLSGVGLAVVVAASQGCAVMMEQHREMMRQMIATDGEWELQVEAEVDDTGLRGVVLADGCVEWEEESLWAEPASPPVAPVGFHLPDTEQEPQEEAATETQRWCERFPVANALVTARFGDVELSVRTDAQGRFAITDGAALARLVSAGGEGRVQAQWRGRSQEARFGAAMLADAAALSLLDGLRSPDLGTLAAFVLEWESTPAAALARARYHDETCGALAEGLTSAIDAGELVELQALRSSWDHDVRQAFCGQCLHECRALDHLGPLMDELARHGR